MTTVPQTSTLDRPVFGGLTRRLAAFAIDATLLLFDWLCFSFFKSSRLQASPGKRLLGMRVVDTEGQRISFSRACGRYAGKGISAFLLLGGFLLIAFHSRKQGLHDVLARTLVIRRGA